MWPRLSLRSRIYAILAALLLLTLIGGGVTVWYTYRIEGVLAKLVDRNLAGYQSAEALEKALVNQKGFVSYYFLDGDPDWLRQLGEYRQIFRQRLEAARGGAATQEERDILAAIDDEYGPYIAIKDQAIAYFKAGEQERRTALHRETRTRFFALLDRCEQYKQLQTERIQTSRRESLARTRQTRALALLGLAFSCFLMALLASLLMRQILEPVRQLLAKARRAQGLESNGNEVKALSLSLDDLIQDIDSTQLELARSREHLLHAEKLALVGKLAAGMAHSIRNPFTSVTMRLFSLKRSLQLNPTQREDFEVISEEIRHIDTIVQNFLEFSRPPKLKIQATNASQVVDQVIQLMEHRLRAYDVQVRVERPAAPLPEVQADAEQLKEVLVNLIVNACEAMGRGGAILIREKVASVPGLGRALRIEVGDSGPGIAPALREKIFQPFFTTKEEGTGLGLSIASRIVAEHGGKLTVAEPSAGGASFVMALPLPAGGYGL